MRHSTALAGIYVGIKRNLQSAAQPGKDEAAAAARWTNEGGTNPPSSM